MSAAADRALAELLLESGIEEAVRSRLSYDFGPELDTARNQANRQLSGKPTDGGLFRGELDSVQIHGLYMTDQALVVDCAASGSVSLEITELKRPRKGESAVSD